MAKINLLPWRERLREKRKKEFIEACGLAAAFGVLLIIIWSMILGFEISHQESRNERLKSEIAQLDKEIEEVKSLEKKRDVMIDRMKIISGLQSNRPQIVHIFDELVRTLPEGVYYKSITRQEGRLTMVGIANSNDSVSALMRKLEASAWFKNPLLTSVSAEKKAGSKDKDSKSYLFNLSVFEEAATPQGGAMK